MSLASTLTRCMGLCAATSSGLGRGGLVQRAVAVLLLGGILLLAPLAFATPVDAGWIAGLYDAADFDDVTTRAQDISALTKVNCVSDASPDWEVRHTLRVVGIPAPLRDPRLPLIFIVTPRSRAPPAGHREGFPRPLLPGTVSRPFPVAAATPRLNPPRPRSRPAPARLPREGDPLRPRPRRGPGTAIQNNTGNFTNFALRTLSGSNCRYARHILG